MFFSSWSNTVDTHISLLEKAQCGIFLLPTTKSPVPQAILKKRSMRVIDLPELEGWLHDSDVAVYEYKRSYEDACHDPFAVLHSSGTTGLPKLLTLAHGSLNPHDSYQLLPSLGSSICHTLYWRGKRVFTNFPWFHGAGLYFLHEGIVNDFVPVVMPEASINAEVTNAVHLYGGVQSSLLTPSLLVQISKNPEYLENMCKLEFVVYAGGPLNQDCAKKISAKTILTTTLGATECGMLPTEFTGEPGDWQYLKYATELGHKFSYFEEDLYELVIVRKKELEPFQGIFFTFPDLHEYPMRDLYVQHPTRKGWWRHCGRKDDVLVFDDARKLNPVVMEAIIETHPLITTAIICGHGRSRPALLIDPALHSETTEQKDIFLDAIWPNVLKAMEDGPPAGKLINKELVVLTSPEKPIPRTSGKGTILRKQAVKLYQEELDKVYKYYN